MFEGLTDIAARQGAQKTHTVTYGPWLNGLITSRQAEQLTGAEASELLNMVLMARGIPRTRPGTRAVCRGAVGSVVDALDAVVGGDVYTFLTTTGSGGSRLYIDIDGQAVDIGPLEGDAYLTNYQGKLIVSHGDNLMYVDWRLLGSWADGIAYAANDVVVIDNLGYKATADHTSAPETEPGVGADWQTVWRQDWLDIVYDNGTGANGTNYQYNNRWGSLDGSVNLGDGTTSRIAQLIRTQAWRAGYTIPPTVAYAYLTRTAGDHADTGPVYCRLRLAADDTILAEGEFVSNVNHLPEMNPIEYDVVFDLPAGDEMLPDTEYYLSIEYDGGTATEYVQVHYSTNDDNNGGLQAYGAAWIPQYDKDLLAGLKPGMGPQLIHSLVAGARLVGIEGLGGDHPAWIWYSAAANLLDWSTEDDGGYVEVMDKHANTFPVGAIAVFYKEVYVFGTPIKPFFAKISGVSPKAFDVTPTLQKVSGDYRSVVVTTDDIYFRHRSGIDAISTIQAYGDVASISQSDGISDVLDRHFSPDDIAGYEPTHGLYLFRPQGHRYTYAMHTRAKSIITRGIGQYPFSPVTRWEFHLPGSVTAFGRGVNTCYVGTDDGTLYAIDDDLVQDDGSDLGYGLMASYQSTGFGELQTVKVSQVVSGKFGGSFKIEFLVNHSRQMLDEVHFALPWDTSSLVEDMIMDVDEMLFDVVPGRYYDRDYVNLNFSALTVRIADVELNGYHLLFGPIMVLCNRIGGF